MISAEHARVGAMLDGLEAMLAASQAALVEVFENQQSNDQDSTQQKAANSRNKRRCILANSSAVANDKGTGWSRSSAKRIAWLPEHSSAAPLTAATCAYDLSKAYQAIRTKSPAVYILPAAAHLSRRREKQQSAVLATRLHRQSTATQARQQHQQRLSKQYHQGQQ